jgi:hypothetical protein
VHQHHGAPLAAGAAHDVEEEPGRPTIVLPFRPPLDRYLATCRAVALRPSAGNQRATRFANRAETFIVTVLIR